MAEGDGLGCRGLSHRAAVAEGRDVWAFRSDEEGSGLHTFQYRRRQDEEYEKGIYQSVIDADLVTKEMGKAEKKRYLKSVQ